MDMHVLCRWLGEEGNKQGNFHAFSGGPRHCPGQGFAYNEIKVQLLIMICGGIVIQLPDI